MARYLPLLRIVITHEYLAGMPINLRFVPSPACAELMQREGLMLRATPHGAELWREEAGQPSERPGAAAPEALLPLAFAVFASDSHLQFCTEWPVATPLRYVNAAAGELLRPETLAGSGAARAPLLQIEIDHLPAPQEGEAPVTYRIALAAKKLHWKYFFSGSLASRKLSIVDLDADGAKGGAGAEIHADKPGVRFAPSPTAATHDGVAFLSETALPLQRLPQQRLQLREEGVAGKVLIRRLPNANVEQLGKERGRDGRSMIVAEIYIHQ